MSKLKWMPKNSELCNLLSACPECIASCHSCGQGLQNISATGAKAALIEVRNCMELNEQDAQSGTVAELFTKIHYKVWKMLKELDNE